MQVQDVMTKKGLRSCNPEANLQEAANAMKAANCGALPVTDQDKKVVGIITDRDICLSLSQQNKNAHAEIPVSEIMGKKVHTVKETDDISVAFKQMRTNNVSRLPVVDQQGRLQGMLSLHNLASNSLNQQEYAEQMNSKSESVMKTFKSLSDNYSGNQQSSL
ncbi:MAG: CBS domain-containing protein [Bacteroidia bacterium]